VKGTEEISIEPLDEEALDEVVAIEETSFPEPWSRQLFVQEMHHSASVFVVMRSGGKVIGYGGYWRVLDEAHITNVAIDQDLRRHGHGSRLLKRLLESARKHGLTRATLEVRESNTAAKNMYAKFGFEAVALRRGYYAATHENAVIMWKTDVDKMGDKDM
jgi:ribosomal-protein-alanine N-acetyltransferase